MKLVGVADFSDAVEETLTCWPSTARHACQRPALLNSVRVSIYDSCGLLVLLWVAMGNCNARHGCTVLTSQLEETVFVDVGPFPLITAVWVIAHCTENIAIVNVDFTVWTQGASLNKSQQQEWHAVG